MKRTIGWTAHAACLAAILLAIWVPFGGRGQWIATAVVLLLLGAMLLGSSESKAARYAEGGEVGPPSDDDTPIEFRGIYRSESGDRPKYGKRKDEDR